MAVAPLGSPSHELGCELPAPWPRPGLPASGVCTGTQSGRSQLCVGRVEPVPTPARGRPRPAARLTPARGRCLEHLPGSTVLTGEDPVPWLGRPSPGAPATPPGPLYGATSDRWPQDAHAQGEEGRRLGSERLGSSGQGLVLAGASTDRRLSRQTGAAGPGRARAEQLSSADGSAH